MFVSKCYRDFPCANHPSGKLRICITEQFASHGLKDTNGLFFVPSKFCPVCGEEKDILRFLNDWKLSPMNGHSYLLLIDTNYCDTCGPVKPVLFHLDSNGRMRMRIAEARLDGGDPVRWLDEKSRRWRAIYNAQLRRMEPDGNIVRFQPYQDRSHDHNGVAYSGS